MDRTDRGGFMTGKTKWIAAALGAALWLGGALAADDAKVAELEKQLKALQEQVAAMKGTDTAELQRQIDVLSKEIESLKLGEVADQGTEGGKYGLGPSASKVYGIKKGVSVGGYGEALYSNPSSSLEDGTPSGADASV